MKIKSPQVRRENAVADTYHPECGPIRSIIFFKYRERIERVGVHTAEAQHKLDDHRRLRVQSERRIEQQQQLQTYVPC